MRITPPINGPDHAANELAYSTDQIRPAWFGSGCMADFEKWLKHQKILTSDALELSSQSR